MEKENTNLDQSQCHRKFNPMKETERDNFYYSLIFLFVPFRDESTLVMEGETMEEAFRSVYTWH